MKNFILGCIFGIVISTIGFTGVAALADKSVNSFKQVITTKAAE
jgi:hypothetical protein